MSCLEGWTSFSGFSLLVLLLLGTILNAVPLIINRVDEGKFLQNPISCFEWWFPGIIGAGLMVIPSVTASLAARKRACCNNRGGMLLSSFLSVVTILGAVYCIQVSAQALMKGPLICQTPDNGTASCELSLDKLGIHPESSDLQWFTKESCILPKDPTSAPVNNQRNDTSPSWSKEQTYKTIHFFIFVGLLIVGALELMLGLSQIIVGFLGCLCGVSKPRRQIV